ncbi:MAG: putative quinol monooxygenase [Caulobacteraceae bacterium]
MIAIVATLKVKDGAITDFESVFRELAAKVRANEAGNLLYQLTRARTEPGTYKVLELYRDQDAVAAHGASDHFRDLGRKMGASLASRPEIEYLDAVD